MENFWTTLPRPILSLAPMEGVTDTVFRRVVARCAKPDVYFTEFTNCDGLWSAGREALMQSLLFTETERPIVAQIWGIDPALFYKTAKFIGELGFDGIDINMGCPVRDINKHGACASLIKNPNLAREIIQATKEGAGNLPISVKTRIGYTTIQTEEWIPVLLSTGIDVLTIHGRTAKELSSVPCHWDEIGKAVGMRDTMKRKTLIIGNGDVMSAAEALNKSKTYGVDGVMIGRGVLRNLWVFDRTGAAQEHTCLRRQAKKEMLRLLLDHVSLFDEVWGRKKSFATLRKYFKIYTTGFYQASELREQLMKTNNRKEVEALISPLVESPVLES